MRQHAKRCVLVPTMGALHKAHGELIRVGREHAGRNGEVAVSIFVNPLQFEPGSDYERYPRPEKADEEFCRNTGVDLLFRPSLAEMYADDRSVFVEESSLSKTLEGKLRPGHFCGVCTVVAKLFNVLAPDARTLNNFATTVQTPQKCPGRNLPSSVFESDDSSTNTERSSAYISARLGRNKRSTPVFRQNSSSAFSGRGYRS